MDPNDLQQRLAGLHNHLVGVSETTPDSPGSDRYRVMADRLRAELHHNHAGSFVLKRTLFEWDYRHGHAPLTRDYGNGRLPLDGFAADGTEAAAERSQLVFFDTETTGLGGAGVVPFLIGCGGYTPLGFEVRQYLIPDYSDEAAMLEALLEELTDETVVVSYNGKAFDAPIVRDRMIVNRVAREIPAADHLDLLHATRRLFRRRLSDCTLTNIERELFGFFREDDIPGFLIPSVYFEWLAEERLDLMPGVLEHNCFDILSLAFLAETIAGVFADGGESLDEVDDLHSLARVYGRRKQITRVNRLFEQIQDCPLGSLSADALWYHSLALKRAGQTDQARQLWEQLTATDGREAYLAHVELAKYFEHVCKEPSEALRHTQKARAICPYGESHLQSLSHRHRRLERKIGPDRP